MRMKSSRRLFRIRRIRIRRRRRRISKKNNEKKKKLGMVEALRKIAKHLNIGEISSAMMEKMVEMPETDDARVLKKGKFSPIRKATREMLNEFYEPF